MAKNWTLPGCVLDDTFQHFLNENAFSFSFFVFCKKSWPKAVWELATWVWFRIPQNIPNVRARWVKFPTCERGEWRKQLQDFFTQSLERTPLGSCAISRLFWANGRAVYHTRWRVLQHKWFKSFIWWSHDTHNTNERVLWQKKKKKTLCNTPQHSATQCNAL